MRARHTLAFTASNGLAWSIGFYSNADNSTRLTLFTVDKGVDYYIDADQNESSCELSRYHNIEDYDTIAFNTIDEAVDFVNTLTS